MDFPFAILGRGGAGCVGGLGAFGGFLLPPVMGLFVQRAGDSGYARGFLVFVAFSLFDINGAPVTISGWMRTHEYVWSFFQPGSIGESGADFHQHG
jgi:hypothetical protein